MCLSQRGLLDTPKGTAVRDDEHTLARMRPRDVDQRRHDAAAVLVVGLAVPGRAVQLCARSPLPRSHLDLAQPRIDDDGQTHRLGDDFRSLGRAAQVARVDGADRLTP